MRASSRLYAALLSTSLALSAAARAAEIAPEARAVLEKAAATMVDEAGPGPITSMRLVARGTYTAGKMVSSYTAETLYLRPDRLLWKLDAGPFQGAAGVSPQAAWVGMTAPPARVKGALKESLHDWLLQIEVLLVRPMFDREGATVRAGVTEQRDEHKLHHLTIEAANGHIFNLAFREDQEGKVTLCEVEGPVTLLDGRAGRMQTLYSEPKAFGGMTIPSRLLSKTRCGEELVETADEEITAIDWNPQLRRRSFRMPALDMALMQASVKKTEEGTALCTMHQGAYDQMDRTIRRLMELTRRFDLTPAGPAVAIFLNDPGQVTDPAGLRTEILVPLLPMGDAPPDLPGEVSLKPIPAAEVAAMTARGVYGQADVAALQALFTWIPANGYAAAGPPRILYYHDPAVTVEEDLLAEVQIPVRKP